ncbi:MAG: protease inhibitor I42 family protein [bacterium]|nr:protease inhibitor I42 family protein [bacterium]
MVKNKKELSAIHAVVGTPFDIYLQSMEGSTGYGWYLAGMPEGLILMGLKKEPVYPPPAIGPIREIFTFMPVKKGEYTLDFSLLRIWEPAKPADHKEYHVVAAEEQETDLEKHMSADKFVPYSAHMAHAGPIQPYGFPFDLTAKLPEIIWPLYGYPIDRNAVSVVENAEKCVVMYGTPWGIAKDADQCTLKYGFPLGDENDLENIILKYGFPSKVVEDKKNCVIKYGTPGGIGINEKNCTLKYGFPVKS